MNATTSIFSSKLVRSIALTAALCGSTVANAGVLLGAGYGNSGLYTLNTANGVATTIAGASNLTNGLGYNSATGVLYGLDDNTMYQVDKVTGVRSAAVTLSRFVTELEYNPLNGLMYTIDKSTGNGNVLATVNTTTGQLSTIGSGIAGDYLVAFAINGSGQGFVAGLSNHTLYRVDLNTGVYSVAATNAFGSEVGMTAMAFDELGRLYGVGLNSDALGLINTTTGSFTQVGGYNGLDRDVRAMEFITNKSSTNVPEPGVLSLAGIALAGLCIARRKKGVKQA